MSFIGVLGLIWLVTAFTSGEASGKTHAAARRTMTFGYVLLLLVRVGLLVAVAGMLAKNEMGSASNVATAWLQGALALTLLFPSVLLPVVVRSGSPRLAYYYTRTLTPFAMRMAPCSSACLVALRALLLRGRASESQLAFIERRFKKDRYVDASRVACHAIIAELRGNRADMIDGLHAVIALDHPTTFAFERRVERYVRGFVVDLLVADAMTRDDFEAIAYLSHYAIDPFARCVNLFADRLAGAQDAPSDAGLVFAFVRSRHKRFLYPLLRRALDTPRERSMRRSAPDGVAEILSRAMRLDGVADARSRYDEARLVAEAWATHVDQCGDAELDQVDEVEARLTKIIGDALPEIVRLPRPSDEPFLLHDIREARLDDAFASLTDYAKDFQSLERRATDDVVFVCSVVWGRAARVWRPMRESDDGTRREAYDTARAPFWNVAVSLLEVEADSTLTHAIFSLLLNEARALGLHEDVATLKGNRELCG